MSNTVNVAGLSFTLANPTTTRKFGPRIGSAVFRRPNGAELTIETPGMLASSSRGVIPHLSRDHHNLTKAIRWVHIPFETFLEHSPPVPTLQAGKNPLHTFLGFLPSQHILSMSIRDPHDGKGMPSNGNAHVCASSLRGVRKISPSTWRSHVGACQPDIAIALSDTPFTDPPYSQKRLTKSIERSVQWLADILQPVEEPALRPNIFVHMSGATSIPARRAFSESLTEILHGREADSVKPFRCLDEGVSGYTFNLVPLRLSLDASIRPVPEDQHDIPPTIDSRDPLPTRNTRHADQIIPLLQASLISLPTSKTRLINSARSPHEILLFIQNIGVDLFDAHWAQRAADIGIALDFRFPVTEHARGKASTKLGKEIPTNGKRNIGHNLYHNDYTLDFTSLGGDSFVGSYDDRANMATQDICLCAACSPAIPRTRIAHGNDPNEASSIIPEEAPPRYRPPYTRAYVHHLLHTHEMTAHSLLVMHNISVLDAFFAGVRRVVAEKGEQEFIEEVKVFESTYDGNLAVFDEARVMWRNVEMARGKGRLAREKAKQEESTLGTAVEL
ncbi:hypothetical protein BDZ94DRAFT_1255195 [Collybia nuda]|uniref:tRNA-guanine(15) transglycosylase-like domain-containing protein n=1 Tax=Collybia nuda TaxID=64659 RepID=A0A9P6CGB6_9AGAR|nr:hypothetical protein BDZ94DRAFT_1255195 [Collybia nuda]